MAKALGSFCRLLCLWVIFYPLASFFVCISLAGPIAAAEGDAFEEAFLYVMAVMTHTAIPLTSFAPTGGIGITIAVIVGVFQNALFMICIGLTAGPMVEPFLDFWINEGDKHIKGTHYKFLGFAFVFYPLASFFLAIFLGGILAAAEEWEYKQGLVMAIGELTAAPVSLPDSVPPGTVLGKIIGLLIGVVSTGFLGLMIAIGSVPLLGYSLTFTESPIAYASHHDSPIFRAIAWTVLNKEQIEVIKVNHVDRSGGSKSEVQPEAGISLPPLQTQDVSITSLPIESVRKAELDTGAKGDV